MYLLTIYPVTNISNSNVLVDNISSVSWFIETKSDVQTLLIDPQILTLCLFNFPEP